MMKNIERKLVPGSKWLYIKIYTGIKTADMILEEAIHPLLENLRKEHLISKWFFIRYKDPGNHLRVRFELSATGNFSRVLIGISSALQEYHTSGEISDFTVETYHREIERYGAETMEDAEFLFWKSSESILDEYLCFDDEEKMMVTLFYMDTILDCLGLSVGEKLDWIRRFNLSFKQEFNADKRLNSQLDKKYRAFIPKYSGFIASEEYSGFRERIIADTYDSEEVLKHILKHYPGRIQDFFQSIFHMHINRMFVSDQRLFEMVIYDYLFRYYKMLAFRTSLT